MLRYIKTAFTNRWNLLAVAAASGFALLSGKADVFLPLVAAAEIAYLGLLGTHDKFQRYVDAQEAAGRREHGSARASQMLEQILKQLPDAALSRYTALRDRCTELRQIAQDLRKSSAAADGPSLDSYQLAGLDRLMWIYLRLLFTQFSLSRFLERTSVERIRSDVRQTESKLRDLPQDESPHAAKVRRALEDNLQTSQERLANFEKARSNFELVGLEIDRLENKIRSLAEMAVNRQEPDYISSQVDQVSRSMVDAEKTMNELQFATGLGTADEQVPEMLQTPVRQTAS
jgi:hypothetical protein